MNKESINIILNGLYGGNKIELSYNNYDINMRIFRENNLAALNLMKDKQKIYHIDKKFILDLYGELSVWINNNEKEAEPILEILWEKLLNEN